MQRPAVRFCLLRREHRGGVAPGQRLFEGGLRDDRDWHHGAPSVSAQVALTRLIKSRRTVPGAPGASRDLLASPWGQARPHLGIMQPEVLLKPAGRPHLGQPGQPQTLRVALEIFRSAESGRQGRHVEPRIKLQGASQRLLRLVQSP